MLKLKDDKALMGPTHALSAVALSLLLSWAASDFMFEKALGTKNIVVFISAILIITGAALMPDLDAVKSTSINVLGIVGQGLSKAMRATSKIIQSTIKGPYDTPGADPHRGFWHTIVAGLFIGFLTRLLTSIDTKLFTIGAKDISVSTFAVMFILYLSIQLVLASLFASFYRKTKNKGITGRITMTAGSLIVAVLLTASLPANLDYSWVGHAVTLGWVIHIFGDMFTVAGVPVLFPIKRKGKRWWNYRMPFGIKAGGFIEYSVIVPILTLIAIVSLYNVIPILR